MAGCFEPGWDNWPAEATMLSSFVEAMTVVVIEGLAFAAGSEILVVVGPDLSSQSIENS